jgi:hypothetical protein
VVFFLVANSAWAKLGWCVMRASLEIAFSAVAIKQKLKETLNKA